MSNEGIDALVRCEPADGSDVSPAEEGGMASSTAMDGQDDGTGLVPTGVEETCHNLTCDGRMIGWAEQPDTVRVRLVMGLIQSRPCFNGSSHLRSRFGQGENVCPGGRARPCPGVADRPGHRIRGKRPPAPTRPAGGPRSRVACGPGRIGGVHQSVESQLTKVQLQFVGALHPHHVVVPGPSQVRLESVDVPCAGQTGYGRQHSEEN